MAIPNTNVVFIDTNLDTHLAIVVSDLDTVSDLKKKILLEHPLCFPKVGQIQIHGIKVKRKGYFYHLSDSMLVRSAFSGSIKSWFLVVDASALGECAQNEQLENKRDGDEEIPVASPCVSEHSGKEAVKNYDAGVQLSGDNGTRILFPGSVPEKENGYIVNYEPPVLQIECEVDESGKGIKDECNICEEGPSIYVPRPREKKKRKSKRKKEDTVCDDNPKDDDASVDNPLCFLSKRESSFQAPQLENKQAEKEEIPVVGLCVVEHTREVVKNLEKGVNSSGNNDPGIPETKNNCLVNHELQGSHVECRVDGTKKGIEDDYIVCEEDNSKSVPNSKKKQKSKRKKEDTMQNDTSKEKDASVVGLGNYIVQDTVVVTNPSENADKEVIKETEVLKELRHTGCNSNNTKNDIVAAVLMKEASEPGPAANNKHRKRKRSMTHDSKELLEVDTAYQNDEVQKSDKAGKERKKSKDQTELNNDKSRDVVEYKLSKVTEDSLYTTPPAKKKKGKEKSGEKSLSKAKLIDDFKVHNASHHCLEDQQRIKNSSADQSAGHFNDTDPLATSVQGQKRKGKRNSSNPQEIPMVTSSRKDKADYSSIQRGVQDEISEDGLFSKDLSMSKTTIDNMEIGTDACKEGIQSTEKRTGNYKSHSDIEIKLHPSDVDDLMEPTEDNENVILDHCHKNEDVQIEGAEEGDVSPQNDPKLMLLDKSAPSNQDNTDANVRELSVTSKVLDVNGMIEPVKPKEKRGMGKSKNSGGGSKLREGVGLVDASESETVTVKSLNETSCDPMSGNAEAKENTLNQTEGKRIQQEEVQRTILSATDKEDDFSADNAGSLEQIKTKSNAEHVDKRQTKKSNKKQTSISKSISNMPAKDQVCDGEKPSRSSDSGTCAKPSVEVTKKSMSTSMKSTNKSRKTNLEPVRLEPSDSQFNSWSNDAAQLSTCLFGEKDDNNLEAPSKTSKVNPDKQLSSQKQQHEADLSDDTLVDKRNGTDRTGIKPITRKNMDGLEATNGKNLLEGLSSSQKLSSKEEHDVLSRIHPDKKVSKVHRNGQDSKLSSRSDSVMSSVGKNRKARVYASGKNMDLEKQREHFPISNSKLEGSKKMVQNKAGKASGKNVGGVVSKTQQKKSLLAGAIFKDDSSGTSEDEDEVDNSDASTRTPSDNPLLSDFSDEDSISGLAPQENGSYGSMENGGRNSLKASLSGTKGMSIDHVLRSSRRFKKAKTTASQLEETQSQPEFVPDSLADI